MPDPHNALSNFEIRDGVISPLSYAGPRYRGGRHGFWIVRVCACHNGERVSDVFTTLAQAEHAIAALSPQS